ncbi:COP9/signalosome complex subunit Csn2 [Apophysomyces sp. BC1015]|nr:COP9/signalosome complex subunit Csn2 [Apophysomyces sp. BC1015]KAG0174722.1 COP9/signalosome complex subunit Csn2 [Apophysomyces sp. BC1021]
MHQSGYIGFTTGTNDAWAVVKEYARRKPKHNKLAHYLPELARLSQLEFGDPARDNTSQLDGFPKAWKDASCRDPSFVRTQLDVGHSMYLKPALKYAASVDYVEPDINLPRILELTGPKKANETEQSYLTRFITTRRQLVCCYPGDVWNESSDRMADLQSLVDQWDQNKDLTQSVRLKIFGETVNGNENMNYDAHSCKIAFKTLPQQQDLPIPDTCPNK